MVGFDGTTFGAGLWLVAGLNVYGMLLPLTENPLLMSKSSNPSARNYDMGIGNEERCYIHDARVVSRGAGRFESRRKGGWGGIVLRFGNEERP